MQVEDSTLSLSTTTGKPMKEHFQKSDEKQMIRAETLFNLKRKHDLSQAVIDSVATECRKDLGRIKLS